MRSADESVKKVLAEIDSLASPDNMSYSQAVEFLESIRDGIAERLEAMECGTNECREKR